MNPNLEMIAQLMKGRDPQEAAIHLTLRIDFFGVLTIFPSK